MEPSRSILTYNVGSWFDDVLVEELPSGKVLLSDNFNDRDHVGWTIVDEGDHDGPSSWSAATGAFVQSSNISGYHTPCSLEEAGKIIALR